MTGRLYGLLAAFPALIISALPAHADSNPQPASSCLSRNSAPSLEALYAALRGQNVLFAFLAEKHGLPDDCRRETTAAFEGADFDALEFIWNDGASFGLQSMPPEIGITRIRLDGGFEDEDALRNAIKEYIDTISKGVSFDWSSPGIQKESDATVEEFVGEPAGMNAIVRFYRDDRNRLVEASVSFAP